MNYLIILAIYCQLFFIITIKCDIRISNDYLEDEESPACFDKSGCILLEIDAWLNEIKNINNPFKCVEKDESSKDIEDKTIEQSPIYKITKDCNDAVWKYRYSGSKGKRKIFNGKGKLSFIKKDSSPPHGYDYGLKSGICIEDIDPDIASISGNFINGILDGEAEIIYFSRKKAKIFYKNGIANGFVRLFEAENDLDSMEDVKVNLVSMYKYKNGIKVDYEWIIKKNNTKILMNLNEEDKSIAIIPYNEGKYHIISGKILQDDMIVQAKEAIIKSIDQKSCFSVPIIETYGDKTFDYDIQIKSQIKMSVAQIVRFLEKVSDEKVPLADIYTPNNDEFNSKSAVKHIHIKNFVKDGNYYNIETPEGLKKANIDASLDSQHKPSGHCMITILSDFKRKDVYKTDNNETKELDENANEYENQYIPLDLFPIKILSKNITNIRGILKNQQLNGWISIKYMDGSKLEAYAIDGALHGLARELDVPFNEGKRKRYVKRMMENIMVSVGGLTRDEPVSEVIFAGIYQNGYLQGPGWKFLVGNSYLFGNFKKTSKFTTDHGAYINQDLENCYVGKFEDGKMMEGQAAKIIGFETVQGIKVPLFSQPSGIVFKHVQSKENEFIDPLVEDPVEQTWVYVKKSNLGDHVGDGLFAKQEIPMNTVFAFFGGLKLNQSEWEKTDTYEENYWKENDDNEVIFIPEEYGKDLNKYKASLGHKINHHFSKWNCIFINLDHPRFGLIPAAQATEKVKKDDELICLYETMYHKGQTWYKEIWRTEIDNDIRFEPYGNRGEKNQPGNRIPLMVDEGLLAKKFHKYATEVLNLQPYA